MTHDILKAPAEQTTDK